MCGLGWKTVMFQHIWTLTQLRRAGGMQSFVAIVSTEISVSAPAVVSARCAHPGTSKWRVTATVLIRRAIDAAGLIWRAANIIKGTFGRVPTDLGRLPVLHVTPLAGLDSSQTLTETRKLHSNLLLQFSKTRVHLYTK